MGLADFTNFMELLEKRRPNSRKSLNSWKRG